MSLGGASPLSPTNFTESKPQQTGTGLLIRHGEVATTSGSTILRSEQTSSWIGAKDALHSLWAKEGASLRLRATYGMPVLRDGVISNSSLFESEVNGANPFPAANFRPVVK